MSTPGRFVSGAGVITHTHIVEEDKLVAAAPTSPVSIPNPLTWLTDLIGSANVQKTLAGLQVGVAGLTGNEGKALGAHIAGMSVGAVYGLAVHYFDYLRVKLGK